MEIKEMWVYIQTGLVAAGGYLGWLIGGYDGFTYALVAFVVFDYLTGVMCGIIERDLSSEIGAAGIFKKVGLFILVAIANIIDIQILGEGNIIRTAVIFFYLSNEGISIIENSARLGLPIPTALKDVLKQLNEKSVNK